MFHARPALHTVFSTTQLELPKTLHDSCHHCYGDVYSTILNLKKR
jgi:hypothetical protein